MNRFILLQEELIGKKKPKTNTARLSVTPAGHISYYQTATPPVVNWCKLVHSAIRIAVESEGDVWTRPNGKKYVESDPAMLPELQRYWEALYNSTTAKQYAKESAANTRAWSAAYISFVMKEAGFNAAQGFPISERHMTYIVAALRNRENNDRTKPFWLYSIDELATAMPVPGDLLCFNSQGSKHTYASLKKEYNGNTNTPYGHSHTDIVVHTRTDGTGLYVETIGGNVHNTGVTVGYKYFKIDGGKIYRLDEAKVNQGEEKGIFAILKLIECPGNRN